jgi:hypothetical protein
MKSSTTLAALLPLALGGCATLFGPASPFAYDKKGELVEFNYAWSAEASRQPMLVRRLRADLEQAFKATAAAAEADRSEARASGRPFKAHRYTRRWETAGQSSRLLSLDGRLSASTGAGATYRADTALWDRSTRSLIQPQQLFLSSAAADQFGVRAGCLGKARIPGPDVADCVPAGVAPVPADRDNNRLFDHFRVVAPGPRPVIVAIPVTAQMLAALKPAYRPGFEVAQSPQ